jgi:hypothetical protein
MFAKLPKNITIPKYNRIRKQMNGMSVSKFYKFLKRNPMFEHKLDDRWYTVPKKY